ncbi:ATP-binding protein [Rubrobacter tropicus]|uniref:ATP-binding protein n=1 Tax=Rubrobacter tropicus TaxID=2653851 RepID=UPI00140C233B|nr:ATP-binding protein [Rubrobacter tropicus]
MREAAVVVEVATGRIVLWSQAASELFGYPPAEALGSNVEVLVPARLRERYQSRLARYRETGRDPHVDSGTALKLPVVTKDSGEIRVELTLSRLERVSDAEPHGHLVLAVVRDAAGRERPGDATREAGLFARSALDGLSAHVAVLDETGVIVATNRAWREFAAANATVDLENLMEGANYLEVCDSASGPSADEAPRVAEAIRAIISGDLDSFELEYPCHSPDERRWFVERVTRFPDGEPPRVIVAHENVTERKLAQEETETRTRQQAVVAELGLRALASANLQPLMDEAVLAVRRTLGVDFCKIVELLPGGEELLLRAGVGWEEGAVGNATEGSDFDPHAGFTLRSEEPVVVEDLRTETRFESSRFMLEQGAVSGMTVPIPGRDGPFGVLGAHTKSPRAFSGNDVNFLQAVANVLATAVERHASEKKLREVREAERDRLARDLHDEALQDLTRALVETRLMQGTTDDPETNYRLERLAEALKRAGQGTRNAIYNLRLEHESRGRTLVEMLEWVVARNRRNAPGSEIELSIEEDLGRPLPEAEQVELLRILQEALLNALRHSGAGRIRVSAGVRGGRLWVQVEDDGRGFDLARTGAGMGIRGMRERAHAVGGELEIFSGPGRGTTVRITLDLGDDGGGSGESEEVRILLVEDHASVRQATASVLDQEPGFRVVGQAGSLSEARGKLEGINVAIIDLGLPDGYGGDLIRDLMEASPGAQALVLSAMLDHAEIARAVESGAAGVLDKLSEMDAVVDAIRRLRAGETLMPLEEVVELLRFAGSQREEEYEVRQTIAQLTSREIEVLQALADGLDSNQVAERLNISIKTETNHMTSILNKLGMHSRLQALVFAIRHGVVQVR